MFYEIRGLQKFVARNQESHSSHTRDSAGDEAVPYRASSSVLRAAVGVGGLDEYGMEPGVGRARLAPEFAANVASSQSTAAGADATTVRASD